MGAELYKVTWEGDNHYCSLDGVEATDDYLEQLCGISEEITFTENIIITNDCIYMRQGTLLKDLLNLIGTFNPPTDYDYIANEGYGSIAHAVEEEYFDTYSVSNDYEDLKIFNYEWFFDKYPNFNLEEYNKVWNSIYKSYQKECRKEAGLDT